MSNVIKSTLYQQQADKRLIEYKSAFTGVNRNVPEHVLDTEHTAEEQNLISDMKRVSDKILRDAESVAEDQIRQAMEEGVRVRETAQQEIDAWWQQRRELDADAAQEAKDAGFRQGYEQGLVEAKAEILANYESILSEARRILEDSHHVKDQIIHEAEPFLINLSSSIAEKIIRKQLTVTSEWIVELVRNALSRRKEKGVIALCISPKHYDYICNAREELLTSIDSQAELQILPDASVNDEGCVIRSAFGSIDARIDTQLNEIKSVLLHLAAMGEGDQE